SRHLPKRARRRSTFRRRGARRCPLERGSSEVVACRHAVAEATALRVSTIVERTLERARPYWRMTFAQNEINFQASAVVALRLTSACVIRLLSSRCTGVPFDFK